MAIMTINLRHKLLSKHGAKRVGNAVALVKGHTARFLNENEQNISITTGLNSYIMQNVSSMSKIKINAEKNGQKLVLDLPAEMKNKVSATQKEQQTQKQPKKEEKQQLQNTENSTKKPVKNTKSQKQQNSKNVEEQSEEKKA